MILIKSAIEEGFREGSLVIDPFDPKQLNPNSYDLRLGDEVRVYGKSHATYEGDRVKRLSPINRVGRWLDAKQDNPSELYWMSPEGFDVEPGRVYLMHTLEVAGSTRYATQLNGKSSLGRLGLVVHATAGFGDVGFVGQWTLEMGVLGEAVRVYPGMLICQISFFALQGPQDLLAYPYSVDYQRGGHYTGEHARGPVASRSWKQFEEDR